MSAPAGIVGYLNWLEATFASIPLALLEVWGRFGYLVGFVLAVCAFCGFTLRPGGSWGFGRERQAWDATAILCIPLTFVLIIVSGYIGSFVVLVPGAQTFESLKDLFVFLCVVLFGYPALITVPFAYGLSDLIEGVPPEFLLDWLPGYFINPTCFWVAYQLFGKNPDFRLARTWGSYLAFVLFFLAVEPVLWGYICSGKFTSEISYRSITPALFFTTSITWSIAPFAMLGALPLARRLGLFWAEIPGHVKERAFGRREWAWEAGKGEAWDDSGAVGQGVPIRMFILAPFVALVLMMVGATAYVTLQEAEDDATKLATRLHQEISENINLRLDDHLARSQQAGDSTRPDDIDSLLASLPISRNGRAIIMDRAGRTIATSHARDDAVARQTIASLRRTPGGLEALGSDVQFRFDHVTAKPLSRETWLAHAAAYRDRGGGHGDWILITAMPQAYYLAGIRAGQSRSAMVFALALLVSLALAALLASMVTAPLRRISRATRSLAGGNLLLPLPGSSLEELGALTRSFNEMAGRLKRSFDDLLLEVETRKIRERQLEESEARLRESENRAQLAIKAARLGIWDWDVVKNELAWDDSMHRLFDVPRDEFAGAYEAWSKCLVPEDVARATGDVEAALRGEREFASEFRVRWRDGSIRYIRGVAQTIRGEDGRPLRMVGINWDVTEQQTAEQELRRHRDHLEDLVRERTLALERSEQRTKGILDNLADAVITIDGSGTISMFSLAASKTFGYAPEEAIGRNVSMLMPEPDASRHDGYVRHYLDTGEARIIGIGREVVGRRKDGSEFPMDLAIAEVSFGSERLFAGVVRDISERKKAEEAIRRSERQLRQVLEVSPIAVTVARLDGRIVFSNARMQQLYGAATEQLASRNVIEFYANAADRQRVLEAITRDGQVTDFEMALRAMDGTIKWVLFSGVSVVWAGEPAIIGSSYDITERRAAEDRIRTSEEQLREVLRSSPVGVLVTRADGRIEFGNDALLRLFGGSLDDLRSRHAGDLLADRDQRRAYVDQIGREGRMVNLELEYRRLDESTFWGLASMIPSQWEGRPAFITWMIDISQRREAEEALREAKEQADTANQAKSAFLANMSHEIRTPMNAVLGHAQLLLRDGALGAQHREQAEVIYRSGNHLLTLINDILEMSKIEAGRTTLNAAAFDLHALFDDVMLMFREQVLAKGVALAMRLDPDLPRIVTADAGKVRQVAINLVSNAVKFTPAGRVDLRASCSPLSADRITVTVVVEDTGCGIEPASIDRIFDAFEQTAAGAREGGTGLGMAISRNFARLMHGDLAVESVVGEGSRFTFTFEAAAGAQELDPEPPMRIPTGIVPAPGGWRILVADDVGTNRDLLAALLSGVGFEVRVVDSGESALREHDAWRPQLILMDLRMPGMGGVEAIRRLRAAGSEVAIVAVSASAFLQDRAGALAAGADEFLAKPYTHAALFAKIGAVIDVAYVHAEAEARPSAAAPGAGALAESLAGLPPDLVDAIREATINARVDRLNALIDRVGERRPEAAAPLRRLANGYQYETLLAALDDGRDR